MQFGMNGKCSRVVHVALVATMMMTILSLLPQSDNVGSAGAQDTSCRDVGPDSGAYLVRLCIVTPEDGESLAGEVTVSATLETLRGTPPEVDWVQFYYTSADSDSSASVLRDYIEPFTFSLPTERWSDRDYRLEADVRFDDDFNTAKAGVVVTTTNGVTRKPTGTGRWTPKNVEGSGPVTVAVVGDGASGLPGTYDVAELIEGWDPQMLLYLGDVYNVGSYTEFMNYYDPTLGRMKNITNPVPGDHEGGRQFQGYQDYWDSNLNYYTATAGSWQLIGFNSTDRFDKYSPGTMQFDWLHRELERHESACTLVFTHNPRWGLHTNYDYEKLEPMWNMMAGEGVDLVVTGHEHNYQRWMPLDKDGNPSANGTTEIVVGTGGHKLIPFNRWDDRVVTRFQTFGALKLVLQEGEAQFEFYDTTGTMLDSGTIPCVDEPDDEIEEDASQPVADSDSANTGVIVNTGGLGALCLAAPALDAEVITLLPDGTEVPLRGPLEGEWWPVRCAGQDGYVYVALLVPGDDARGNRADWAWSERPYAVESRFVRYPRSASIARS